MKVLDTLAHLFIPRHSNNQKAKLLHPQVLIFFVLKLIVLQGVLQFLPASGLKILGYAANIPTDEVIRLTNERRQAAGLNTLEKNDSLSAAALAKGTDMINNDYWAHVSPDGTQPWKFFTDFDYKYRFAGENLARDFADPASVMEAWIASPTHRENLLSSRYEEIGVAVVEGDMNGVETTIIVQFFGTKYADTLPVVPIAEAKQKAIPASAQAEVLASPAPLAISSPAPSQAAYVAPPAEEVGPVGSRILISPFKTTKGISLIVVGLLLNMLIYDGFISSRRKIARIGGRTFAHLSFLGMILAIVLILKAGQVI